MVLLNGARLFLDRKRTVRGCVCSSAAKQRPVRAPGGRAATASSCSALVARRCVRIDPRRTASMWNPTTDMLNVLTPLLLKTIRTTGAPAKSRLITSVVARHTRLAVGVMAAARSLRNPNRRGRCSSRRSKAGPEFWQSCVADLASCSERLTTDVRVGRTRANVTGCWRRRRRQVRSSPTMASRWRRLSAAVLQDQRLGIESVPIWATTAALAMLATPCAARPSRRSTRRAASLMRRSRSWRDRCARKHAQAPRLCHHGADRRLRRFVGSPVDG